MSCLARFVYLRTRAAGAVLLLMIGGHSTAMDRHNDAFYRKDMDAVRSYLKKAKGSTYGSYAAAYDRLRSRATEFTPQLARSLTQSTDEREALCAGILLGSAKSETALGVLAKAARGRGKTAKFATSGLYVRASWEKEPRAKERMRKVAEYVATSGERTAEYFAVATLSTLAMPASLKVLKGKLSRHTAANVIGKTAAEGLRKINSREAIRALVLESERLKKAAASVDELLAEG